jgi:hypothetical protein
MPLQQPAFSPGNSEDELVLLGAQAEHRLSSVMRRGICTASAVPEGAKDKGAALPSLLCCRARRPL